MGCLEERKWKKLTYKGNDNTTHYSSAVFYRKIVIYINSICRLANHEFCRKLIMLRIFHFKPLGLGFLSFILFAAMQCFCFVWKPNYHLVNCFLVLTISLTLFAYSVIMKIILRGLTINSH